jgi:hypothetical protein
MIQELLAMECIRHMEILWEAPIWKVMRAGPLTPSGLDSTLRRPGVSTANQAKYAEAEEQNQGWVTRVWRGSRLPIRSG